MFLAKLAMCWLSILFLTLHSLQDLESHVGSWPSEVLTAIYKPLESTDKQDYPESNDTII